MAFIDNTELNIQVKKTKDFYNNISIGECNIVKFILSDDEIDYNLSLNDIYDLHLLQPITLKESFKNQLQYDNNTDTQIILDKNSILFNLDEIQKITNVQLYLINGIEKSGFIIENNYLDFINIINTGKISTSDGILTDKYINSDVEILNESSRFQIIGNSFQVIISNNIPIDQQIFELAIYSLTYPISIILSIKII